ncbi:unnamed protein product [Toxocara canis]|uniref:Uncharacterized protein n=1 Tax=Toxocara canis TaxID=6265 RepID=A0A183V376_TOXCA|nr:unnamed protein product [Toxocara canis]
MGLVAGLVSLAEIYPPSRYTRAWLVGSNSETARIGLLVSLISKGMCYCSTIPTLIHLFEIISFLFAGLNEESVMKYMGNEQEVSPTSLPRLPDTHIMEQLIAAPLRVMNLYYTLVTERAQLSQSSSSSVLPRGTLSPVRKALPVGGAGLTSAEQRTYSISHLVGTSVKPSLASSFLLSSTLTHVADSLKGAYVNYLGSIGEEVRERFTSLLNVSLNTLSCVLEMALFSHVSALIEEYFADTLQILLYCRITIDLAPAETTRLVTQLFKILFGRNAANLSVTALRKMHMRGHGPPRDILEAYLLRSANVFTEFVVNSNRNEYFNAHLLRSAGWLRKDTTWKAHAPQSATISPFIGLFEPFVSLTIRLYQSSSSYALQTAVRSTSFIFSGSHCLRNRPTLNLLCELVRGGINFSMLDPEMRLLNFVISQVNEFGTRSWCNEKIQSSEGVLLRSIFEFFAVLSHVESRGQMIIEPSKMMFFAEALLNIAEAKPHLSAHALNCLEVVALDFIGVRFRFEGSLVKVLRRAESLSKQCPTEMIQLWGLLLYGAAAFSDDQRFPLFLTRLDFHFVVVIFQNIVVLLSVKGFPTVLSGRQRMLYVTPYLFMLLCVLKEDQIFSRIEQICDCPADKIARLLMGLLWECLVELRDLSVTECSSEGIETEMLIAWYLHMLSYAVRSGSARSVCASFATYLNEDTSEIRDISTLHPRAYAQLLAFYSVLGLNDHAIFFEQYDRLLDDEARAAILRCCVDKAHSFSSLAAVMNVVELIESGELRSLEAMRFLADEMGESFALDERITALVRALLQQPDVTEAEKRLVKNIFAEKMNFLEGGLCKSRCSNSCEYRLSELDKVYYTLNAIDPISFDSEALVDLLISSVRSTDNVIRAECVSRMFSNFDADSGEKILRAAYAVGRFDIISSCIEELENMKVTAMNCGEMYSEYSVVCVQKAQNLFAVCVKLAFDPSLQSSLQFLAQSKIAKERNGVMCEQAASWALEPNVFQYWIKRYADYLFVEPTCCSEVDAEFIEAITFAISQPSFISAIEAAQNSRQIIEQQLALAVNLGRLVHLLRMKPSCRSNHQETNTIEKFSWKVFIHDRTGRKDFDMGFFSDAIQTAFDVALKLQEVFRKKLLRNRLFEPLERCEWRVELEVHRTSISVPTVNIHYLTNVDVLKEFTWRLSWAGWNRRANFDNFSMSLFGVLSSTPTGSELCNSSLIMSCGC